MTQAKGIARKAIALDPNLPEAHGVLALISRNQLDMGRSQSELAKANALPGASAALQGAFADGLADNLQFDRARQVVQSAIASDPLNMELKARMGSHLISARRYDQAFPIFESILANIPTGSVRAIATPRHYCSLAGPRMRSGNFSCCRRMIITGCLALP